MDSRENSTRQTKLRRNIVKYIELSKNIPICSNTNITQEIYELRNIG